MYFNNNQNILAYFLGIMGRSISECMQKAYRLQVRFSEIIKNIKSFRKRNSRLSKQAGSTHVAYYKRRFENYYS